MEGSFPTAHQWYAQYLGVMGNKEASLEELLKANELDPRNRATANNLSYAYFSMGMVDEAERVNRQLLSWAPNYQSAWYMNLTIQVHRKDRDGVENTLQQLRRIYGRAPDSVELYMNMIFEPARRKSALEEIRKWLERDWSEPGNPSLLRPKQMTYIFALIGETETVLQIIEEMFAEGRLADWGYLRSDRMIPEFNCDPDVQSLLMKAQLPPMTVPYPCEELLP